MPIARFKCHKKESIAYRIWLKSDPKMIGLARKSSKQMIRSCWDITYWQKKLHLKQDLSGTYRPISLKTVIQLHESQIYSIF